MRCAHVVMLKGKHIVASAIYIYLFCSDSMHFKCASNQHAIMHECILTTYLCDGNRDCEDNSDENNCTYKTLTAESIELVNNTHSINNVYEYCSDLYFHCASGECIPLDQQCDGRAQCADSSDELGCSTGLRGAGIVLEFAHRNAYISHVSSYNLLIPI